MRERALFFVACFLVVSMLTAVTTVRIIDHARKAAGQQQAD